MGKSALITSEEKNNPILIVDKKGVIGKILSKELARDLLVVFVSSNYQAISSDLNIIHVPYNKKFPEIPDNIYSYIVLIDYEDFSLRESFPLFLKKAKNDDSVLIFASHVSSFSEELIGKIKNSYKKAKVVLLGDVFGDQNFVFDNPVEELIKRTIKSGKLVIPGDGLGKVFPIYFEDTIKGLIEAIFGLRKSQVFFLFPKNPVTFMSLFKILKRRDPGLSIDFDEKRKYQEPQIPGAGEFLIDEKYNLEEKFKKASFAIKDLPKDAQLESLPIKTVKFSFKKHSFFFTLLIFLFLLPLVSTASSYLLGGMGLYNFINNLEQGNISQARKFLLISSGFLKFAEGSSYILEKETVLLGLSAKAENLKDNVKGVRKLSEGISQFMDAADGMERILLGKSQLPEDELLASLSDIRSAAGVLKEVELERNIPKDYLTKLRNYSSIFNIVFNSQEAFYYLIDPGSKKDYLVLFQNNMEIRPTGGFIGSYGILSFDKGKLSDFSIHDVYDADGQLKGHIEPPYPIRRYLPSVHWYLRDSNFDIDFPKAASDSAFLFFEETGKKVDAVIGVDVSFIKNLISVLGPIKVADYNETINSENFFKVTESHVEKNSFPSSAQKKDFLNSLFKALQNNISQRKNLPYFSLFKSVSDSIEEKHIIFAFSNPNIQNISIVNGWSSSLWEEREEKEGTINDFIGINEANLGVNKANAFIGRSVSLNTQIQSDGIVKSDLSLDFRNESDSWPGGDYKTYLRIILPQGISLSSIAIDGVSQNIVNAVTDPFLYEAKNFKPPKALEVEKKDELGKTIYGFLTIVPLRKSKSIKVSYVHLAKVSQDRAVINYNLKIFKQPGTEKYPFNFMLSYPSSFNFVKI